MYRALLICNAHYPDDPRELPDLNGPTKDGIALRDALTDPVTGMFDRAEVQLLTEPDSLDASSAIEEFYQSAEPDDSLLFYYSGHGRQRNQQLFLCTRNTVVTKPYATAIPSSNLNDIISNTHAQVRIIILDCCNGDLFKGDDIAEKLAGEGRYVIAASSATGGTPDSRYRGDPSPFTNVLVDGLRAKAHDRDEDGIVDLDDLWFYLDSLSLKNLAPQRNYAGSGAVPIARREVIPRKHQLEHPGSVPTKEALTSDKAMSNFLDLPAQYASYSSERVSRFRTGMRRDIAESMPEQLTAGEFLQRAGLIHDGQITYTGALLFSDSPTLALPSAIVQCARFTGQTKTSPLELKEIRGPVPDLVVQARDFVAGAARLGEIPTTESPYTQATYSYPMIAVREIIANAIVHRDYESHEACVQLHMFSDRIEVVSPGSWEGTERARIESRPISKLERQSWQRNFHLSRILTWSRLVEGVGAGLPRAVDDCKTVGAPEPIATVKDGVVTVTIFPRTARYLNDDPMFSQESRQLLTGREYALHRETRPGQDPRQLLARRLRALREETWPGRKITQPQLARALGGVSIPLISSWESRTNPRIPASQRLEAYAALFASPRSFDEDPGHLISPQDMTQEEQQVMGELKRELMRMRGAAMMADFPATGPEPSGRAAEPLHKGPWYYPDGKRIAIVCAQWPQEMMAKIPYASAEDPDFIELLTYSDLDALFELHGHMRAANPANQVHLCVSGKLTTDDYTSHLVTLGGIDWSGITSSALRGLELPVRQVADWNNEEGHYFEVQDSGKAVKHRPILGESGGQKILREDVALFARTVNPFNRERYITICNGMYGRGTYGVVRALTDANFRDRNAEYLESRFGNSDSYCILTRVPIVSGTTLTPDWTNGEYTLFEWRG